MEWLQSLPGPTVPAHADPRVRRGRRPGVLVGLVLGLIATLAACGGGPGEDQMLAEKDLAFPGASQVNREFDEPLSGRLVDGRSQDRPAQLRITYRTGPGVTYDEVLSWYREQLAPLGWEVTYGPPQQNFLQFVRKTAEHEHTFLIHRVGGPSDLYDVTYSIRGRP